MPFVFVLDPAGVGLLLKRPPDGDWWQVGVHAVSAMLGIAAVAAGVQKWALRACSGGERWVLIAGGLALVYPWFAADAAGFVIVLAVLAWQRMSPPAAAQS